MRKAASIFSISLLSIALSAQNTSVNATSTINVTSEGDAHANVNVQSNFNSTNNSTTTNATSTKIRIESNGEVKEYESNETGEIHIESSDGNSKVTVKNGAGTNSTSLTPLPTDADHNTTHDAKQTEKEIEDLKEKQRNFFEKIAESIRNFFKNLF